MTTTTAVQFVRERIGASIEIGGATWQILGTDRRHRVFIRRDDGVIKSAPVGRVVAIWMAHANGLGLTEESSTTPH